MKRIGFVIFPGFQIVDLAALPVFELANLEARTPQYDIQVLSEHGGSVLSSVGVKVDSVAWRDLDIGQFDTVIAMGGLEAGPYAPEMLEFLRAAHATSRRTGSICSGAFALAEAGILDGRRATTHWAHARELKRRFPSVRVEDDRIYIVDGNVWTSAGMTACIDLALAMVESDLGAEMAKSIARKLVVYHKRAGGQSQFSALLELGPKTDRIQDALDYAKRNLKRPLSVTQLAEAAHSERATVQSRVSRGDRPVSSASHRESARRSGACAAGVRAAHDGSRRERIGIRRSRTHATGFHTCLRAAAAGDSPGSAARRSVRSERRLHQRSHLLTFAIFAG